MSKYSIVIVGEENLTRSIFAEAILKQIFKERDVKDVDIISRGNVVLFSEPISPKAAAILHEHGCEEMTRRSTELTQEDIDGADLVLAVGRNDLEHLKEHFETNTTSMFLGTFIDMEEEIPAVLEDTREAYEECFQVTRQAMEAAADRLIAELLIP
ncbi:MAG: hypothetical protein Q4E53_10815 [Eubacteriales bacterium]|nr:hypothetical protein [Eubacteriales bacterium]